MISPRSPTCWLLLLTVICLSLRLSRSFADEPQGSNRDEEGIRLFEKKIRPILIQHCYRCHSREAKRVRGGLLLDTREGLLKGGDTGPGLIPGKPDKSLLIQAMRYQDLKMPPKEQLPVAVINDFVKWVEMGAPDPRGVNTTVKKEKGPITADQLWSVQPVRKPSIPTVRAASWPRSDIDRFILARLEERAIGPVEDAEPYRLLRRMYFDLTGLPPSPKTVLRFLEDFTDKPQAAIAKTVDELLSSPQFGERWGRHWLDTARYADTLGGDRDRPLRYAWRYRNHVIDALNADMAYDRFLLEQVAGDLLPAKDWQQRERQLVATGFLAVGSNPLPRILPIQTEAEKKAEYERAANDWADDQIDAVGRGILGLTISCARCHDHKYDPIPTRDYYALAGIFQSTELRFSMPYFLIADAPEPDYPFEPWYYLTGEPKAVARAEAMVQQWQAQDLKRRPLRARIRMLSHKIRRAESLKSRPQQELKPAERALIEELPAMKAEIAKVTREYTEAGTIAGPKPDVQLAIGAREARAAKDVPILIRGEWNKKDKVVPRGFLTCVSGPEQRKILPQASGRLELGLWLTDPNNPLPARVAVNRIWHHLFGRGIVESLDNFGSTGADPSHPELLDYMAHRFVHEHGWSVKKMIREIVLSRTYQLASVHQENAFSKDPSVELFWRARPGRLESEAIRDALLFVAGQLDLKRPKHNPLAATPYTNNTSGDKEALLSEQGNHRSVYVPIVRGKLTEFQTLFNQPVPDEVNSARNTSTLASQALYFMNGKRPQATARAVVERIFRDRSLTTDAARLDHLYLLVLARKPFEKELTRDREFLASFVKENGGLSGERRAWNALCLSLLMSADFLYRF